MATTAQGRLSARSDLANAAPPGASCFVCLESSGANGAADSKDDQLLRGCGCRGTAGYAHVGCIVKAALKEEERHAASTSPTQFFDYWTTCPTCKQTYTGSMRTLVAERQWEIRKGLSPRDPRYMYALVDLAEAYMETGACDRAERHFSDVIDACRSSGDMHGQLPNALRQLASCRLRMNRFDGVRPLLEEALRLMRELEGPDSPNVTVTKNDLVMYLCKSGKMAEALPLATEVMETQRRTLGRNDRNSISSLNTIAQIHASIGDIESALRLGRESVETSRRVLGPSHPDTMKYEHLLTAIQSMHARPGNNLFSHAHMLIASGKLIGLTKKPELNGLDVSVEQWLQVEHRYKVHADGNDMLVKPTNIILASGTKVVIGGLVSASHFNGKQGVVDRFNEGKGRYVVAIEGGSEKKSVLVKPDNCIAT